MKLSLGIAILSVLIGFTSCVRDYTCECTYRYSGAGHPPETSEVLTMKTSKKDAKSICEERSQFYVNAQGDSTVVNCVLY